MPIGAVMKWSERSAPFAWLLPFLLLAGGMWATYSIQNAFERNEVASRQRFFDQEAGFVLDAIEDQLHGYLGNVSDLAIFSGSHDPPTQQQFARFVESTGMISSDSDALLFYVERVEADELPGLVARERQERSAPFFLLAERTAGGEDLALLMRSGLASDVNGMPGVDLAASSTLRDALDRSAELGQTILVDMSTAFRQLNADRELAQQYGLTLDGMGEQLFDRFGVSLPGNDGVGLVSVTPVFGDDGALVGWIFGEVLEQGFLEPYASGTTRLSVQLTDDLASATSQSTTLPGGAFFDNSLVARRSFSNGLLDFDLSFQGSTGYRPIDRDAVNFLFATGVLLTILISGLVYLKISFGEATEVLETRLDITSHRAMHDELTGLPNRASLLEDLEHRLSLGEPLAVLFIDVDRLKVINDSLGHAVGDQSLIQVAGRLRDAIDPRHHLARFGGDEFVVAITDPQLLPVAEGIARAVLDSLEAPLQMDDLELRMSASIGVAARDTNEGAVPGDLLRDADAAMYKAKDAGGNNYQIFDNALRVEAVDRLELEQQIELAIHNREFEAWYQPIVDVPRGQVVALEALVRWRRSDGELEMPGRFLPVAHETGQIVMIGEQVMQQSCQKSASLAQQGLFRAPQMAINVSERELADPNFLERVERSIRNAGIAPQHVTIEINENIMIDRVEASIELLRHLERQGLRLSIDDFGTGLSSLSYFKRLSMMNELKIDRSFVMELCTSVADQAIVTSIVAMSRSLGIEVIAEGVETIDQTEKLLELGVSRMQGYYFCRPKPPLEIDEVVRTFALPDELTASLASASEAVVEQNIV